MNEEEYGSNPLLVPTRRLKARERAIFDRITNQFNHLRESDAEQLTQYSEASIRYENALKETQKHPVVTVPVVNRSTGNIIGEKTVRNPAYATLKEATQQMTALARRLLIDAHSAEKRQRLLTKNARAFAGSEQAPDPEDSFRGWDIEAADPEYAGLWSEEYRA